MNSPHDSLPVDTPDENILKCKGGKDNHRLFLVKRLLPTVSSVATFESTDIKTFRQSLTKIMLIAVEESKDFPRIMVDHVNWTQLIQHHDSPRREISFSSPLEEVLILAIHPTVVPLAYSGNLCAELLRILLHGNSTSKTWTKSDLLLLNTIQTLRRRVPTFLLEKQIHIAIRAEKAATLDRLVSILRYLAKDDLWFGIMVMKCMLTMLRRIDTTDVKTLIAKRNVTKAQEMCWQCQRPMTANEVYEKSSRKRQFATLSQLHDEDWKAATLTTPASRNNHCTCLWATRQVQVKARQFTQLPFCLVKLRSRLYRKILSIFENLRFSVTSTRESVVLPVATVHMLRVALDISCRAANEPSLRLAILLMTDLVGKRGYEYMLSYLWEKIKNTKCEMALRIYTEIIMESLQYSNQLTVWKALLPLAKFLETEARTGTAPSDDTKVLLGAFASILAARRVSATNLHKAECPADAYDDFVGCMLTLKQYYGNASYWTSPLICDSEPLLNYLQDLGVLPFTERQSTGDKSKTNWPFMKQWSIRAAYVRMGPRVVTPTLFSNPDDTNTSTDKTYYTLPIMECLNDDVLLVIFSYLSYRPLASASKTCRSWNKLLADDSVWQAAYRTRYTIKGTDEQIQNTVLNAGSWKLVFRDKFQAQKALKFQRSPSTGFKYRTCHFCGCLKVLRSQEAVTNHELMHTAVSVTKKTRTVPTKHSKTTKPSFTIQTPTKTRTTRKVKTGFSALPTDAMAAIELYLAANK